MRIRPVEARDRDRVRDILAACGTFTQREIGWAMELVDAAIADETSEYRVHVLEEPESGPARRVQGYVCYGVTPKTDDVYDLYWIAVDPTIQRRGFGQILLRFVENEVRRQNGRMLLIETWSRESNAPTIRFYRRAGYDEISRIKDFYRVETDKIVLCKRLSPL